MSVTPDNLSRYHSLLEGILHRDPECNTFRIRAPKPSPHKTIRICFGGASFFRKRVFAKLFYPKALEETASISYATSYKNESYLACDSLIGYMESQLVILPFKDERSYLLWLRDDPQVDFLRYTQPAYRDKTFVLLLNSKDPYYLGLLKEVVKSDDIIMSDGSDLLKIIETTIKNRGRNFEQEKYVDSFVLVPNGIALYPCDLECAEKGLEKIKIKNGALSVQKTKLSALEIYLHEESNLQFMFDLTTKQYTYAYGTSHNLSPFLMMQSVATMQLKDALEDDTISAHLRMQKYFKRVDAQDRRANFPAAPISVDQSFKMADLISKEQACYEDQQSGALIYNDKATGVRLPAPSEWVFAYHGFDSFVYSGSNKSENVGWVQNNASVNRAFKNLGNNAAVGCLESNSFGIYDMTGFVLEYALEYDHIGENTIIHPDHVRFMGSGAGAVSRTNGEIFYATRNYQPHSHGQQDIQKAANLQLVDFHTVDVIPAIRFVKNL